jgi:hypothetical protein
MHSQATVFSLLEFRSNKDNVKLFEFWHSPAQDLPSGKVGAFGGTGAHHVNNQGPVVEG